MKQCGRCRKLKDESEFSFDKSRKDNLNFYCRECVRLTKRPPLKSLKDNIEITDKSLCGVLKYHHSKMDEDNERLSTQFIVDVIRHKI